MPSTHSDYRTLRDPAVIAATIAALAIRLFNSDAAALWLDEIVSALWARDSWAAMLDRALRDNHLPIHPLVLKAWVAVAGDSAAALRVPSVVASAAAVPVIAACAAELAGKRAARWGAFLAALSPYMLHHAQEARMYPFLALFGAINFYAVLRYVTDRSDRPGTAFWLSNLCLLATHYYGAFIVVGGIAAVVLLKLADWRRWAPAVTVSTLAILAPLMVFLFMAWHRSGSQYNLGLAALPGAIWTMIGGYAMIPSSEEVHADGLSAALPYLPFAAAGGVALVVTLVAAFRTLASRQLYACVIVAAVGFAGPFAVYFLGSNFSINPRYLIGGMAVLTALMATGCAAVWDRRWGRLVPLILLAIMCSGTVRHLADPGHGREDVHPISDWLARNVPGSEPVLVTSGEMTVILRFHAPAHHLVTYPESSATIDASTVAALCSDLPVDAAASRVIFVFGRTWESDVDGLLEDCVREKYVVQRDVTVRGVRLYELTSLN